MFVLPVIAVALAWLLTRWRPMAYLGFAIALALTVTPVTARLHSQYSTGATRWQEDTAQVGAFLDRHRVKAGIADYWFAYRYDAAVHERTVFASLPSMHDRFQPYDVAARMSKPSAVIVYAGLNNDKILEQRVSKSVSRTVIDRWAVYYLPNGLGSLGTVSWAPEPDLWVGLQLPDVD